MKNIYLLLKLNRNIKSIRIKNLGIFLFHLLGKRYFGIFLDPVLACNLRCRMCYFSDDTLRKQKQSRSLKIEEVNKIANAFFHRALKLQIGCGAEPSLYPHNKEIIRLAKEKRVPYISITTNGNLFNEKDWRELISAGLDEVTLSLHGVHKESYEYFMTNASYEAFTSSLKSLTQLKKEFPNFKIRVNYTINSDNLEELAYFFDVFKDYHFDILQFRPIQELGDTIYNNFSWETLIRQYDSIIEKLRKTAKEKGITFIAPSKQDLTKENNNESTIFNSTYFYISSQCCWESNFNLDTDTYESYAKRTGLGRKLFYRIFQPTDSSAEGKKKLNYDIQ